MASRLLKHMGFEKNLAEAVRDIIQGRGEVRRKYERKRKMEEHRNHQRRQMEAKAERKRERALRHRDLLASHRRNKKRGASRSPESPEDTPLPSLSAPED